MQGKTFISAQNRWNNFIGWSHVRLSLWDCERQQYNGSDLIKKDHKQCTEKQIFENRTDTRAKMKVRDMQIWGLLLTLMGWIFVACSIAMEGWKVASVGGQGGSSIITVGWYWSSLWRACYTDSAATSNCYDFPVLWAVEGMNITKHF